MHEINMKEKDKERKKVQDWEDSGPYPEIE